MDQCYHGRTSSAEPGPRTRAPRRPQEASAPPEGADSDAKPDVQHPPIGLHHHLRDPLDLQDDDGRREDDGQGHHHDVHLVTCHNFCCQKALPSCFMPVQ